MKTAKNIMIGLALVAGLMSCRDKATEKRIAELESRIAQLEGNKNSTAGSTASTPAVQPAVTPAAEEKPDGPLPTIEFESMDHDFGTITEGQKVAYEYKFKNNGTAPLIIQTAQPSCGCTAPDWTRDPIPPGGTGFVKAEFDSKNKVGPQNKTITVTANTYPKQTTLKFKASVVATSGGAPAK